jgi:hypothetical protein
MDFKSARLGISRIDVERVLADKYGEEAAERKTNVAMGRDRSLGLDRRSCRWHCRDGRHHLARQ